MIEENVTMLFTNNSGKQGGGLAVLQSAITFEKSVTAFSNNTALVNGGLCISVTTSLMDNGSYVGFSHNISNHRDGATYGKITKSMQNNILLIRANVSFEHNAKLIRPTLHIDLLASCDEFCLNNFNKSTYW